MKAFHRFPVENRRPTAAFNVYHGNINRQHPDRGLGNLIVKISAVSTDSHRFASGVYRHNSQSVVDMIPARSPPPIKQGLFIKVPRCWKIPP
jgi:hypothetical protein